MRFVEMAQPYARNLGRDLSFGVFACVTPNTIELVYTNRKHAVTFVVGTTDMAQPQDRNSGRDLSWVLN